MANPAFNDDDDINKQGLAAGHVDRDDAGAENDSDEDFEQHAKNFAADPDLTTHEQTEDGQWRRREIDNSAAEAARERKKAPHQAAANDEIIDVGPAGDDDFPEEEKAKEEQPDEVDLYLAQIEKWRSGEKEFVNDADAVDQVRAERLRLAQAIDAKPHLIADRKIEDAGAAEYLKSDLIYLARSDASSDEYGDFIQKRAELRDRMFQGAPVLSSEDYVKVAKRAQGMISQEKFIDDQYDMIDLRREASREHFDNPRFIAEIYRHSDASNQPGGLMDEILIDFDRRDLLDMDEATKARSDAQASFYADSVANCVSPKQPPAKMVENFLRMRETGLHVRHNQRAITGFVDIVTDGGPLMKRAYEIGMAGLDNEKFGDGMWDEYARGFSKDERKFLIENKGPAAVFVKARENFEKEMLSGDPRAAKSFAVLEHAAEKINKSPKMQAQLSKIGDLKAVAALHAFGKEHTKSLKEIGEDFDKSVVKKMGKSAISEGKRQGSLDHETESGEIYSLKVSKDTSFEVVDGAHVRFANNADELKAGKGIVLRLDGIVAPPEGESTKSGQIDAGLESKSNLNEILNRHGVDSVGIKIDRLESGEQVAVMRTKDNENVSQRMLRDGFAMPTRDSEGADRREDLTRQAEGNRRGLWAEGFPDMDQSWRRENKGPDMTWKDKRLHLDRSVNDAMCTTKNHVTRKLMQTETKLFALPLKEWSASRRIDEEISKIANKNPTRIMDIYNNNMEVLDDLRKRKDKLTQPEMVAHDKLAMGRRALGEVLVNKNLLDPQKFQKDSHPFMSRSGIKMSKDGIRAVTDATITAADATIQGARKGAGRAKKGALWMLDEAMS